jgi:hypothetical protein
LWDIRGWGGGAPPRVVVVEKKDVV